MLHTKTIAQLADGLRQRTFSSVELTQHFLQRIQQFDSQINSFITVCPEHALQQAKAADDILQQGNGTALTGIPLAHKDIFCTAGIKTSCASKMLDNFIAPYDATIVQRLQQAGVVTLGKTNMDEFAMGSSNETSFYGTVRNPWDLQAVAGGSSGGSAAAVAAHLTPAATGSDTGGSIRQPAALCGLVGLKPTYGLVSRYGMIAFASSLDQAGVLTQTAEDAGLLLQAMAGYDELDSTTSIQAKQLTNYTATLNQSLQGLKIGLPKEFFSADLNPAMATLLQEALTVLTQAGATLHEISLPNSHLSVPTYYIIASAECSSNLARYDGVRYGYRCENPKDLTDLYKRTRAEGFGAEVKRRVMIGSYVLSAGYYDAYYRKAQQVRQLISNDFKAAFAEVDVIACPTSPTPAFNLGEKVDDPVTMYLSDIYTILVNLAGLPAISTPAGFLQQRPIGLQLIGNYFKEAQLLNIVHQYQQRTDWHTRIPEGFA